MLGLAAGTKVELERAARRKINSGWESNHARAHWATVSGGLAVASRNGFQHPGGRAPGGAGPAIRGWCTARWGRTASTVTGPTVLLIDDDEFAFKVVTTLLEEVHSPITLEWAEDFEKGLARLTEGSPDVCLLDYQLGERSGLELLRRAVAAGCRTPIVMLTAQTDRALDLDAMKSGAVDFLIKGEFGGAFLDRVVRYAAERARTQERLRESEERYALAVSGSNDGSWDWQTAGRAIFLSPRWKQLLGLGPLEVEDTIDGWLDRVHLDDHARLEAELAANVAGSMTVLETDLRMKHKDGTWRWVRLRGNAVRNADGHATRMAGSLSDVTTARSRDPLTGLANRVLYLDRLEHALIRHRRDADCRFAVLFLDCDRFKVVNDSLGHNAGDALLIAIARRLEESVRAIDTVARFGGDEFAILLDDAREPDGATRVAERIVEKLAQPFQIEGREVFSGASIGIAMLHGAYKRPDEVLRDADTAMYRAKALGRGRVAVFDQVMHERAMSLLQLEGELRRAIPGGQLELLYQPLLRVADERLEGFEALVRWRHPQRGLLTPEHFITLAEETGVIGALDSWVLEEACTQAAVWNANGHPLKISVNASRRHLDRPGAASLVLETLARTGLPKQLLCLEVTETVVLDNPQALVNLTTLRDHGVQVVMDDFGTGYSSLGTLHRLPFTGLKIDKSFVAQLSTSPSAREVVRAIITLGTGLKLAIAAEGVETKEQLAVLKSLSCELMQGYLFARPMPLSETAAWIAKPRPSN